MPDHRTRQAICQQVARLLEQERTRQGLSMTEVGAKAGLSQQMISYVERGMRIPTLDTLLRITEVLAVPLWELLKQAEETVRMPTRVKKKTD